MTDLLDSVRQALSGRYQIVREIGRGGMATVYLAQDLKHPRQVALKVLRPEVAAALGAERFLREIELAARLQHPHILGLLDSGTAGGVLYYVMPYVEGESLRHRLDRESQLPLDDAVPSPGKWPSALDYAHRHGVIHRESSPRTSCSPAGQALVADFGIAKALRRSRGREADRDGPLARHAALHESGAGLGDPLPGWPSRHLRPGLRAVRDARGRSPLHGSQRAIDPGPPFGRSGAEPPHGTGHGAGRDRVGHHQGDGQGAGRPVRLGR